MIIPSKEMEYIPTQDGTNSHTGDSPFSRRAANKILFLLRDPTTEMTRERNSSLSRCFEDTHITSLGMNQVHLYINKDIMIRRSQRMYVL